MPRLSSNGGEKGSDLLKHDSMKHLIIDKKRSMHTKWWRKSLPVVPSRIELQLHPCFESTEHGWKDEQQLDNRRYIVRSYRDEINYYRFSLTWTPKHLLMPLFFFLRQPSSWKSNILHPQSEAWECKFYGSHDRCKFSFCSDCFSIRLGLHNQPIFPPLLPGGNSQLGVSRLEKEG